MHGMRLLSLALASVPYANALIRFGCSQLVTERYDPLVNPGKVSPHLHQIVGGNAFNISMDTRNDIAELSTCTTCRFKEDKSNYWTAVLYFKHPNGTFIRVPQMSNHNTGPGLQAGGMTVYYFQPSGNKPVTAFKKGFRMLVGDAMRRRSDDLDPNSAAYRATSFRCFNGTSPDDIGTGTPSYGPTDSFELPNGTCSNGIRSNIYFPRCWNGVDLDPADHQSHVAYPVDQPDFPFFGAVCPPSHPVSLPVLFMEIVWDTRQFNDPALWPKDGSQPFVFSMGDPYGYGQHADYVFGWEGDSLQRAMDTCTGGTGIPWDCPTLAIQSMEDMNSCRQGAKVPEITENQYLNALPGCNPIQTGPGKATPVPNCSAPASTVSVPAPTAPPALVTPPWTVCNDGSEPGDNPLHPYCSNFPSSAIATPTPTITPAPL